MPAPLLAPLLAPLGGVFFRWIIAAILAAWGLISGATAIAGGTMLTTALALLPERMGTAPDQWLRVVNWYMPLNEAVTLFVAYAAIAGALKFIKLSSFFKK